MIKSESGNHNTLILFLESNNHKLHAISIHKRYLYDPVL